MTPRVSFPLLWWIPDLNFVVQPLFFVGMELVTASSCSC
jgi:hypothetical protein